MNQQNRRQVGNLVVARMLTANQVDYPDSEKDFNTNSTYIQLHGYFDRPSKNQSPPPVRRRHFHR